MKGSGQGLDQLLAAMKQDAESRSLIVCSQMVAFPTDADDGPSYPFLDWEGDDAEYVAMAAKARARIFYGSESAFNYEASLTQIIAEAGYRAVIDEDDDVDEPNAKPVSGSAPWLLDRLRRHHTTAWNSQEGDVWSIQCVWFAEGVAHMLQHFGDWYVDFRKAAQETIDEAQELRSSGMRIGALHPRQKSVESTSEHRNLPGIPVSAKLRAKRSAST